jgi:hypothetical protein
MAQIHAAPPPQAAAGVFPTAGRCSMRDPATQTARATRPAAWSRIFPATAVQVPEARHFLAGAFPLFSTRPGTIISAPTPQELTERMRQAELPAEPPNPGGTPGAGNTPNSQGTNSRSESTLRLPERGRRAELMPVRAGTRRVALYPPVAWRDPAGRPAGSSGQNELVSSVCCDEVD